MFFLLKLIVHHVIILILIRTKSKQNTCNRFLDGPLKFAPIGGSLTLEDWEVHKFQGACVLYRAFCRFSVTFSGITGEESELRLRRESRDQIEAGRVADSQLRSLELWGERPNWSSEEKAETRLRMWREKWDRIGRNSLVSACARSYIFSSIKVSQRQFLQQTPLTIPIFCFWILGSLHISISINNELETMGVHSAGFWREVATYLQIICLALLHGNSFPTYTQRVCML